MGVPRAYHDDVILKNRLLNACSDVESCRLARHKVSPKYPIDGLIFSFEVHVVNSDVPILLSLADMDKLDVWYNNLTDVLTHRATGATAKITREFGHPFLQ